MAGALVSCLWESILVRGGEIVRETHTSRLPADSPAIEVHQRGDVYKRDAFVYWGFPAEGLRRPARIVGLDEIEVVDEPEVDGHPRTLALLRTVCPPVGRNPCRRPRPTSVRVYPATRGAVQSA